MARIARLLALALAIVLAVACRLGLLGGSAAFFLAVAIGAIQAGRRLLSRLSLPIRDAAEAVLARPESRRHAWTYWVYLATLAVTAALITEILAGN